MKLCMNPDGLVEFVTETATEKNLLTRLPMLLKVKGKRLAPGLPHILQNIIKRIKKESKTKIWTQSKTIVDWLSDPLELQELPEDFEFFTAPLHHQRIALRYLWTFCGGLLLDPGLGKTKIILDYIALKRFKKSLIVCPVALVGVWLSEVKKHRPDLTIYAMQSTNWEALQVSAEKRRIKWQDEFDRTGEDRARLNLRKAELDIQRLPEKEQEDLACAQAADVIVVNYNKTVIADKFAVPTGANYLLSHFDFDFIALDEALIKSHTTERTKSIMVLGSHIPYRTILSGTLINNTEMDAFSPIRFLDPSLTGMAFGKFDFHYGTKVRMGRRGPLVTVGVTREKREEIKEILESCCLVMRKDEWLQLPPKQFHPVIVPLSEEQKAVYNEIVSTYTFEIDGTLIPVENGLAMMAKLSQISNGFLYYQEKSTDFLAELFGEASEVLGDRETMFFPTNPKLEKLTEMLGDELSGKKFILWYNYQAEYQAITERLESLGVSFLSIRGGSKNTSAIVDEFNQSNCQVLICQSRAVNYGITVLGQHPEDLDDEVELFTDIDTEVYTHVFFSLGYSLEIFLQQQDRSHRIGQRHPVDYYLLLGDCDADLRVYEALQNKVDLRESMLVDFSRRMTPLV